MAKSQTLIIILLLLSIATSPTISRPTAAVSRDEAWIPPPAGVSCTMCSSCDNPCQPRASPPPPPPPAVPASSNCPPPPSPPSSATYYYPPPPAGGDGANYYPPSGGSGYKYPTPSPPNPIMPYFPFYYYSPPPPSRFRASSSQVLKPLPQISLSMLFFLGAIWGI